MAAGAQVRRRPLEPFNKHAGLKLDVKAASVDALDAVKARTGRICPLICETGFRADGDKCVKITCRKGYEPNDEGTYEKIEVWLPRGRRPLAAHRHGLRRLRE